MENEAKHSILHSVQFQALPTVHGDASKLSISNQWIWSKVITIFGGKENINQMYSHLNISN